MAKESDEIKVGNAFDKAYEEYFRELQERNTAAFQSYVSAVQAAWEETAAKEVDVQGMVGLAGQILSVAALAQSGGHGWGVSPFMSSPASPFMSSPASPFMSSPASPFMSSPASPFMSSGG